MFTDGGAAELFLFDRNLRDWLDFHLLDVASEAKLVFESFLQANGVNRLDQLHTMVPEFWSYLEAHNTDETVRLAADFLRIQQAVTTMAQTSKFVRGDFPLEEWTVDDVCDWVVTLPLVQDMLDRDRANLCSLFRECRIDGLRIRQDPSVIQNEIKFRRLPRRTRLDLCIEVQNVSSKKSSSSSELNTNQMPEEETSTSTTTTATATTPTTPTTTTAPTTTSATETTVRPTRRYSSSPSSFSRFSLVPRYQRFGRAGSPPTAMDAPVAADAPSTTSTTTPSRGTIVEADDTDEKDSLSYMPPPTSDQPRHFDFDPFMSLSDVENTTSGLTDENFASASPATATPPTSSSSFRLPFHRDPCNYTDICDWTTSDVVRWITEVPAIRNLGDSAAASILNALTILGIDGAQIVEYACRTRDGEGNPLRDVLLPDHWRAVQKAFNDLVEFDTLSRMVPSDLSFRSRSDLADFHSFSTYRSFTMRLLSMRNGGSRSSSSRMRRSDLSFSRSDIERDRERERERDRRLLTSAFPTFARTGSSSASLVSSLCSHAASPSPPREKLGQRRRKRAEDILHVTDLDFSPEASNIALDVPQSELQQLLEQKDLNAERQELDLQRFHLTQEYSTLFKRQTEGNSIAPRNKKCVDGVWQMMCTEKEPFSHFPGPLPPALRFEIVWFLTGFERMESRALFAAMRSDLTKFEMRQVIGCSRVKSEYLFIHRYRQSIFDTIHRAKQRCGFERRIYGVETLSDFQKARRERLRSRGASCDVV